MTSPTLPQTQYLTVAEVAAQLRVSRMTVYRMCKNGSIPNIRTGVSGRAYRIPADSFARYLAGLEGQRPAPAPLIPGQTEILPCSPTGAPF